MASKIPLPPPVPSWDAPLPDASERHMHVMEPRPGIPLRGMFVADSVVGILTHWFYDPALGGKGRTVPHVHPKKDCYCCSIQDQLPRWNGYAACWLEEKSRYFIFHLTAFAVQTCPALDPKSGRNLRGQRFIAKRTGRANNSPVAVQLDGDPIPEGDIPLTFDVRNSLQRLWSSASTRKWRMGDKAIVPERVAREERK